MARHRHQEFLKFLRRIDRETPSGLTLHLILDNYSAHKHDAVNRWLKRHPRFQLHYTPTSSSWLNLVERWLREVTDKCMRRSSFHSVAEFRHAITEYLEHNTQQPKPFIWTESVANISEKLAYYKAMSGTLR